MHRQADRSLHCIKLKYKQFNCFMSTQTFAFVLFFFFFCVLFHCYKFSSFYWQTQLNICITIQQSWMVMQKIYVCWVGRCVISGFLLHVHIHPTVMRSPPGSLPFAEENRSTSASSASWRSGGLCSRTDGWEDARMVSNLLVAVRRRSLAPPL